MDYDKLVQRLHITRSYLANHPTHGSWEEAGVVEQAADAITQLRAERDALKDELRRTCEHLGLDHLLAERDALRHDIERHVAIAAAQATEIDALAALLLEARRELHNDGTGYMQTLLARIDALAAERDTYAEDNRRHTEATNCMMDDLVTLRKRYERLSTASRQAYALAITEINIREAETVSLKADLAAARAKIDSLRHHVKALQLLVKMQHAPQDMKLFAAEVDAIDAALAGKDAL